MKNKFFTKGKKSLPRFLVRLSKRGQDE